MQSNVPPHNYPWERDARALAYLEARVAVERAEHFATQTPATPTGPRHPAYLHRVQLRAFLAGVASTLLVCLLQLGEVRVAARDGFPRILRPSG
jgi:hypothetical protein